MKKGLHPYEFIPNECTVNKEIYIKIMRPLRDAVGGKCLEKWA
jgi:hypothetical protein